MIPRVILRKLKRRFYQREILALNRESFVRNGKLDGPFPFGNESHAIS